MNCDQLFRTLGAYLDAEMKRELCAELEDHVKVCSYCRAHVHTMQSTIELTHRVDTPPVHEAWVRKLRMRVLRDGPPDGH